MCFTFVLISGLTFGQSNRYMVFFKDKNGSPYSTANPSQFLSQASILRRLIQQIPTTADDLPPNQTYVDQVRTTGAKTFFTTRWMNGVLIEADVALVSSIAVLSFVDRVELVAPGKKLAGGKVGKVKNKMVNATAQATQTQLEMIGIDLMHQDGFTGESIDIAIFDSGFIGVDVATPFQGVLSGNRLISKFDFVGNTSDIFQYDNHGTAVFSVVGAYAQGEFTGGSFGANFHLYVTEDVSSEYRIEEYNWLFAAEKADSIGVYVINSSLGYNTFDDPSMDYTPLQMDGQTAIVSRAATWASSKGMIVVSSAGNSGGDSWKIILPPADADGILAVGAVNATALRSSFSSTGPTADQRIKPDVMAMGSGTSKVNSNGTISTSSGTSLASPLVASLVADVWQANPNLTSTQLIEAIKMSADRAGNPDNLYGYGIPHYLAIKNYLINNEVPDELFVYPNPTLDSANLVLKNLNNEQAEITVYDALGKPISKLSTFVIWRNNPQILDFSNQPPGLYLIHVVTGKGIKRTVRVIKN